MRSYKEYLALGQPFEALISPGLDQIEQVATYHSHWLEDNRGYLPGQSS